MASTTCWKTQGSETNSNFRRPGKSPPRENFLRQMPLPTFFCWAVRFQPWDISPWRRQPGWACLSQA